MRRRAERRDVQPDLRQNRLALLRHGAAVGVEQDGALPHQPVGDGDGDPPGQMVVAAARLAQGQIDP